MPTAVACSILNKRCFCGGKAIEACISYILGPGARLVSAGGNCALPGCGTQYLHMDGGHRWKTPESAAAAGQPFPHRCQFVALNFGIENITEEMGATEIWIGSNIEPSTVPHSRALDPDRGTEQLEGLFRAEVVSFPS